MFWIRRTGWHSIILIAILGLLITPSMAATTDDSIKQQLKRHYTTGAAVVVAKDGEIVYEYYYGYSDKANKRKITADTYFRLASVTKIVTGVAAMQLVEKGELTLDADISEYLGYTVQNPYHRNTPVTLRQLMTHTSALNPHGGYTNLNNTLRELISTDHKRKANWYNEVSGSKYRYSNFGAGIMGSLIESITGQNIQDVVDSNVFTPLNITAAYSASLLPDPENIATLYNTDGTISDSRASSLDKAWDSSVNPDEHFRITVGSLWMKPTDLCKIGMMLCDRGRLDNAEILKEGTVLEMESEQRGKGGITTKTPYGLCIQHEQTLIDGKTIYGHQGLIDGILCNLYYDPETNLVFVFCSNGCHNQMENRVAHITRKIFGIVWKEYCS